MAEKKLYALTNEDVSVLKDALHGPLIGMTFTGGPQVSRIAHAANALNPMDRDDAIERMARAAFNARYETESFTWAKAGLFRKSYLADARAALDALYGTLRKDQS